MKKVLLLFIELNRGFVYIFILIINKKELIMNSSSSISNNNRPTCLFFKGERGKRKRQEGKIEAKVDQAAGIITSPPVPDENPSPAKKNKIEEKFLNDLPAEILVHIFSFLGQPHLLKMRLVNKNAKEIAEFEDQRRRQREINLVTDFIKQIEMLDSIDIWEAHELKRIDFSKCLNVDFNLPQFLSNFRYKLKKLLNDSPISDLAKLKGHPIQNLSAFENFINTLSLKRMWNDGDLIDCLNEEGRLDAKDALSVGRRLYTTYIRGMQLSNLVEKAKYNECCLHLNHVDNTIDNHSETLEVDIHPDVLEVINFAEKDKFGLETQKFIIGKIKARNSWDTHATFLELDIEADIYFTSLSLRGC